MPPEARRTDRHHNPCSSRRPSSNAFQRDTPIGSRRRCFQRTIRKMQGCTRSFRSRAGTPRAGSSDTRARLVRPCTSQVGRLAARKRLPREQSFPRWLTCRHSDLHHRCMTRDRTRRTRTPRSTRTCPGDTTRSRRWKILQVERQSPRSLRVCLRSSIRRRRSQSRAPTPKANAARPKACAVPKRPPPQYSAAVFRPRSWRGGRAQSLRE